MCKHDKLFAALQQMLEDCHDTHFKADGTIQSINHASMSHWTCCNAVVCCLQEAGPNHYWISGTDVPYMFELGGPAHEGCAGIVALSHYLHIMAAQSPGMYHMLCLTTHTVKSRMMAEA